MFIQKGLGRIDDFVLQGALVDFVKMFFHVTVFVNKINDETDQSNTIG